ncbi:helix-turn-helix domain-containing protein [Dyella telluris]|uniref:Helix-turn-helix transcriptional regulator n=1 Tax=Dyella telluris TaxID=2763498 RepID=A0A7G8Q3K7_9GAMM|nr:AraC family transcriptional regulator [Dyella telluris]QNK01365.1 helix-turn-helix transcriptional regulator [Dyella telluris]
MNGVGKAAPGPVPVVNDGRALALWDDARRSGPDFGVSMNAPVGTTGRYPAGSRLLNDANLPHFRAEHWSIAAGNLESATFDSNVVALVTSGRSRVSRRANGATYSDYVQPGTASVSPLGLKEDGGAIANAIDVLLIYLPRQLVEEEVLINCGLDPSGIELAHINSLADPTLHRIGMAMLGAMQRGPDPSHRLFLDGMHSALAGHLLGNYTVERWRPQTNTPDLDPRRLKRVLDLIELRFAETLSLSELAAQACLSEFHFSRLFRAATGLSPYRYVTHRRVEAAEQLLANTQAPQLEIALETGFGSQANFIRVFRKLTGMTPGQFRAQRRDVKTGS